MAQDAIDDFIALPQDQQIATLQALPKDKQDKLLDQVKERRTPLNTHLTTPNSPDYAKNHPILSAIQDAGKGALNTVEQIGAHPIQSVEGTISTLNDIYNADPGTANPSPETLAARQRLKEQFDEAKKHPAFTAGGVAGGVVLGKVAGEVPRIVPKAFRVGVEAITGTGSKNVEDLVSKTKEANKAEVFKAADKNAKQDADRVEELKKHHAKTEDIKAANEQAKASAERKEALNRGVEQLDQEFQGKLKDRAQAVRQEAGAKYDTVRAATGEHGNPKPVEYVRKGQDLDLDATAAKLPPVKDGYTRLYRSESPTTKFEDVFDKAKLQDNRPEGKAYTDDLNSAAYYKQSYGRDAKTTYIDVPNSVAESTRIQPGEYVLRKAATVPSSSLASAVREAEMHIQGSSENLKIFRDILSKNPEDDPDFIEYHEGGTQKIPKGHPLYDILREQGQHGTLGTATFSDLQGYYTELGSQLSKGNLPADVYLATKSLQESIGNMMQKMANESGVGPQLTEARDFYRGYVQTFRDHNSPIYKALTAKERGEAIKAMKGKDVTGIEALAKYDPELAKMANTVRGYQSEAGKISSKTPNDKPLPKLPPKAPPIQPKVHTIGPEDISAAKAKGLEARAQMIRRRGEWIATGAAGYGVLENALRGEYGKIPRMMIEGGLAVSAVAGIAKLLEDPKFVESLTKATPKDVERIPPEMRRSLGSVVQSARAKGIQVSPAFSALATSGGSVPHPVLSKQSPVQPATKVLPHEDADAKIPPQLENIADSLKVRYRTQPGFRAQNGEDAIASVDPNNPNTININDPVKFGQGPIQLRAHELYHLWRNNLPGPIRAKALPDNPSKPYDLSDLQRLRAQGYTMATIPQEQGGMIVQQWAAYPEKRKAFQPWIDDMGKIGMSLIEGTGPEQKGINTTPRPPLPPAHAFQTSPAR